MRVGEFDDLAVRLIVESDHPEIVSVKRCATSEHPDNPSRLVVQFADESTAVIMVGAVEAPGLRSRAEFELPREAL